MHKLTKIAIILITVGCLSFLAYLFYLHPAEKLSSNNKPTKQPESGELYYVHGCDNLSFINVYQNRFKGQAKLIEEWKKHNDLAQTNFSKVIELIPDCANAYWKRGRCKFYRWLWYGKPEDNLAEIADYKKAIDIAPTSTEVRCDLWRAYLNSGKHELAKEEFQTIISLDPDWRSLKDLERRMQRYNEP